MSNQDKNFKFQIKNVRCFAEEQHLDIRPLTFLVGENSTGKTTIMGCFSIIYDFISKGGWRIPDFNREPYFMGSFVDIARKYNKKEIKNIQKNSFELSIAHNTSNVKYNFHFVERDKGAEPVVNQTSVDFKNVTFSCKEEKQKAVYTVRDKKDNKEIFKGTDSISDEVSLAWHIIDPYIPRDFLKQTRINQEKTVAFEAWKKLRSHKRKYFSEEIFSLAPVRSKPQRTYNPIKEFPSSEGNEIPVTLMRLSNQGNIWKTIHKKLVEFGKASGLFLDIKVKKYGGSSGDPFQLQFQVRDTLSNIIDTGYGVSQILPLLIRLFTSNIGMQKYPSQKGVRFLLQQPEVHLHPKAQAELTSLLVQSVKMNNSFLIETHSDYIIDRTRIEIRKGNIPSDKVSLIYLEPIKKEVKAHNIFF